MKQRDTASNTNNIGEIEGATEERGLEPGLNLIVTFHAESPRREPKQQVADPFGDGEEDLAGWAEELTRALHPVGAPRAGSEPRVEPHPAAPPPDFDRIVGLGFDWLSRHKPAYAVSEGLHLACSAAAAVCAAPSDAPAALQLALADEDEVFDGRLDADQIRDLIFTIHPAHQAADILYQTAP